MSQIDPRVSNCMRVILLAVVTVLLAAVQVVDGQVEIGPRRSNSSGKARRDTPKPSAKSPIAKQDLRVPDIEMVLVPAGTFEMGSNNGDDDEKPVHRVTISKSFLMGKYEVTQGQWVAVMGANPSRFTGNDDLPVENVSWDDWREFIRRLNSMSKGGWRLPTEAEWEYACRAGTSGDFAGKLDELAWYADNSGSSTLDATSVLLNPPADSYYLKVLEENDCRTHLVGTKRPNKWGFHDMHGNVSELCQDSLRAYTTSSKVDPLGEVGSGGTRGGGWNSVAGECRSSKRQHFDFSDIFELGTTGLRLARDH